MKLSEVFPSKYLKADEWNGDLVVTIKRVTVEELGSGAKKDTKPVLYFQEADKGLACNKTNSSTIAKLYGDDTDDWIGKRIILFSTDVEFGGEMTRAIRVRAKSPLAAALAANPAPPAPQSQPAAAPAPAPVAQTGKLAAWGAFIGKWSEHKIDNPDLTDADRDTAWKALLKQAYPDRDPKTLGTQHWDELAAKIKSEYSPNVGFVPF
jgi:hypothetical protein